VRPRHPADQRGTPIDEEDLSTLHAPRAAGIPVMGLLSKADLLSPADRERGSGLYEKEVRAHLGPDD